MATKTAPAPKIVSKPAAPAPKIVSKPAAPAPKIVSKPAAPAAKAESIKPDLLPVDLGGGQISFVKRGDYAKRTAENFCIKHKADIKRDHVTQALDAIDAGQTELTGENPEEFVKLFDIVLEDYKAGQEEAARLVNEKKEAEEKAAREKKEKEEAEENTFLAVKDITADFSTIAKNFDTGDMDRFVAKPGTKDEDLFAALNASFGMGEFTSWMQGDIVVELEKRGQLNVISKVAEARGQSYATIHKKASTCKAFPPEKRVKGVSYTICAEVALAKFTGEKQLKLKEALVNEVLEGKVNTQEARVKVREIQGKEDPKDVPPEENEKFQFLVYDPNAELGDALRVTVGFPKELFAEGAIVINPKTCKSFAKNGFKRDASKRWEDMPTYIKPEEKKTEAKKK